MFSFMFSCVIHKVPIFVVYNMSSSKCKFPVRLFAKLIYFYE